MTAGLWHLLRDVIPNDHARQVTSEYYLEQVMTAPGAPLLVVDLGCGSARSAELFRTHLPEVRWYGIDIVGSPESTVGAASEEWVVHYDGEHLPLRDASVPLIYSHQVFEHVRRPHALLAEIHRVLAPGGLFIGSTSQLEPYHSYSVWNYTPYGFRLLCEDAGLQVEELRPSIDGLTLIRRSYESRPPEYSRWFVEESPLNQEIDAWAAESNRRPALVNLRKLQVCGQFAFKVRRPA